jgi:hypothetical protein
MKLSIVSLVALLLPSASAFAPSTVGMISRCATSSTAIGMIKTGPAGTPAKSKEEDLELTTQVILDYVNSMATEEGVSDEEVDEE